MIGKEGKDTLKNIHKCTIGEGETQDNLVPSQQHQFSLKSSQKTPHSSPVRVKYGVSFVSSKFDLCSLRHLNAVSISNYIDGMVQDCSISIANVLEILCYDGTHLYYGHEHEHSWTINTQTFYRKSQEIQVTMTSGLFQYLIEIRKYQSQEIVS